MASASPPTLSLRLSAGRRWVSMMRDLRVVVEVLGGVLVYEASKRRLGLPSLIQRFDPPVPVAPREVDVLRLVRLTRAVLGRLYRTEYCLPQALIRFRMLTAAGFAPRLVTGVRREATGLAGHAWIELAGAPLGEPSDPTTAYAVTYSYSSR